MGHVAELQCCGYVGCAGNLILIDFLFSMTSLALLEVKLVPTHCLVLVHDFGNAKAQSMTFC